MNEANLDTRENFVILVFDEVKVNDNLVYDKRGVRIIGFVDIGNVNNELLSFEQDSSLSLPNICWFLWCVVYLHL